MESLLNFSLNKNKFRSQFLYSLILEAELDNLFFNYDIYWQFLPRVMHFNFDPVGNELNQTYVHC